MARCAFFVSAPTVRFLNAMEQVRLLPALQRRNIAADVYSAIAPLTGSTEFDHLRRCARALQDERWRLISSGVVDIANVRFARATIVEQWLRGQLELLGSVSPVTEILAERRCRAVEQFIRENFSPGTGQVLPLRPRGLMSSTGRGDASKTAA